MPNHPPQPQKQIPFGFYAAPPSGGGGGGNGMQQRHVPPPPPQPMQQQQQQQHQQYVYNNCYSNVVPLQNYPTPSVYHPQRPPPPPPPPKPVVQQQPPPPPPPSRTQQKEVEVVLFRCQPCNVTLDSATALQAHTDSHIQCQQCDFTGAPRVVKGHCAAAHGKFAGSGIKTVAVVIPGVKAVQRFAICVGNHPDDVQRWIAERRKRFPRQTTVSAAAKSDAPTQQQNQNQQQKQTQQQPVANKGEKIMSQTTGLSSLLEGYGSSSSDDDDDDDEVNPKVEAVNMPAVPPTAAVAPSADAETTAPSSSSEPPGGGGQVLHYQTRPCRFFARNGNCRNGDTCNFSHDRSQQKQQQQQQGPSSIRDHDAPPLAKKQRTTGELVASTSSGNAKASLLQKLLANDMKREAILTLQILDYIVGSSFLQEQE